MELTPDTHRCLLRYASTIWTSLGARFLREAANASAVLFVIMPTDWRSCTGAAGTFPVVIEVDYIEIQRFATERVRFSSAYITLCYSRGFVVSAVNTLRYSMAREYIF